MPTEIIPIETLINVLRQAAADEGSSTGQVDCQRIGSEKLRITETMERGDGNDVNTRTSSYIVNPDRQHLVLSYKQQVNGTLLREATVEKYEKIGDTLYPVKGIERRYLKTGELYLEKRFEVLADKSTINPDGGLPDDTFEVDMDALRQKMTVIEGQASTNDCGGCSEAAQVNHESACSKDSDVRTTSGVDGSYAGRQEALSESLAKTVEVVRDVPPPSRDSQPTSEAAPAGIQEDAGPARAGIAGWQAGAWGGLGALVALSSTLLLMRFARRTTERTDG